MLFSPAKVTVTSLKSGESFEAGISTTPCSRAPSPDGHVHAGASDAAIVMFGDGRDWHGRSLARAFKRRGITPLLAPLDACGFSTETATGLAIPGLGDRLPEGAFVRFVPGGSFEEVTLYLGVLHALRELGVTVWNDARAIERCVDKSTTTFFLQRAGMPTPAHLRRRRAGTRPRPSPRSVLAEGHRLVQKPLFGAQGKGLRLISSVADLASPEEVNGVYYLQEFIPPAQKHHQDWRLFVCRGRVVAAMIRHGSSWITNIKQGARAKAAIASQELVDLAVRAAACVGADYAGVDIIQARDGRFLVLEVNSMPAWNGLQRVSPRRASPTMLVDAFLDAALPGARLEGQEGA